MKEIMKDIKQWARNNKKCRFWLGALITLGIMGATQSLFFGIAALIIYEAVVS